MLEYVSNVEKQVTFAYKDLHFINPECGADGTWGLSLEALTTIAHGLYARKVHAPIEALNPYGGMEPAPAVPTMKDGHHECQCCQMSVKGKDLMQHMAFHIGCGKAKWVCPPCLFCGHTDDACRLQMTKTKSANARWQPTPRLCAHHCFQKASMGAVAKQIVHNEPIQCVVLGCGRWESHYNMPGHLLVDDTHKNFPSQRSIGRYGRLTRTRRPSLRKE